MGWFPHAVVTHPLYTVGMGLVSSLRLVQVPLVLTTSKKQAISRKAGAEKTDFLKVILSVGTTLL